MCIRDSMEADLKDTDKSQKDGMKKIIENVRNLHWTVKPTEEKELRV